MICVFFTFPLPKVLWHCATKVETKQQENISHICCGEYANKKIFLEMIWQ